MFLGQLPHSPVLGTLETDSLLLVLVLLVLCGVIVLVFGREGLGKDHMVCLNGLRILLRLEFKSLINGLIQQLSPDIELVLGLHRHLSR